ncbi:hypothetical protein Glove_235g43 [Diversispora epigaea]|uniref:Uncharacterized protein n=1 Tax=Diversispora epigaea TaxID=1348612 RepID=A0A397IBI5_9GLOM|nr:hypothetical protein Glove_235g43 [Diversispora epigaea]
MAPLLFIFEEFIIKTNEKLNKTNYKIYCNPCIKVLDDVEGKKIFFPNKKDHIISHLKKCTNFINETTIEKREEIFALMQTNNTNDTNLSNTQIGKRKDNNIKQFSSVSQGSKVVIRSTSFGTLDNYIVRQLLIADMKKFYTLLLRLSLSCGWTFH